jgi:hypothetical protein
MTIATVLREVYARGIVLTAGQGKLRYSALRGDLSPQLKALIQANRAAVIATLEGRDRHGQQLVSCSGCIFFEPAAPERRLNGPPWEMPGGCALGRTSPTSRPPVYPFTGHRCEKWLPVTVSVPATGTVERLAADGDGGGGALQVAPAATPTVATAATEGSESGRPDQ